MDSILETPKKDWLYIIFSSLTGFSLILFFYFLREGIQLSDEISILVTFLIFTLLFDARHLFSTYSRTFLDRVYYAENKGWLNASVVLIIALPLVGFFIVSAGEFQAYNSNIVLVFASRITLIFGLYHLIKQNWGFMVIYKKKSNERDSTPDLWEKIALLSGSFIPLIWVAWNHSVWFPTEQDVFFPPNHLIEYVDAIWQKLSYFSIGAGVVFLLFGYVIKIPIQFKFVSRNLGFFFLAAGFFIAYWLKNDVSLLLMNVFYFSVILFVFSLGMAIYQQFKSGYSALKKWAVFTASLVLYHGILFLPIENKFVLVMAITIPHNIQYLQFVQFFNRKQYVHSAKNHGLAKRMSEKAMLFFGVSLVYALLFELGRTGIRYLPIDASNDTFFLIRNAGILIFISLVLHHYYLDAVIWRVRKDVDVEKHI